MTTCNETCEQRQRPSIDEILSTDREAVRLKLVTIEVPEPKGYELTREYRPAKIGEYIVVADGSAYQVTGHENDFIFGRNAFILRKVWEAPIGFPTGSWVYWSVGAWYVSPIEPKAVYFGYAAAVSAAIVRADTLALIFGGEFTPPPVQKIQVKR